MPEAAFHIWRAFQRMSIRRGNNGFGLNPLSWPEIDAFTRLSGTALEPWEIEIVEHLDSLFLAQEAKEARARRQS